MDSSMKHQLDYSKDDDPCDDWSGVPIPKPKEDNSGRTTAKP